MSVRLKILAVGVIVVLASGHSAAQNPTLKTAMREKLSNAQGLLEAVVRADYAAMTRSVDALGRISEIEIGTWQAAPAPEYLKQATQFLMSVQGLRKAAEERNVDAALNEYTALISSCTRCHAFVRRARLVMFEP